MKKDRIILNKGITINKICEFCHKKFGRNDKEKFHQFLNKKTCSLKCKSETIKIMELIKSEVMKYS